MPNLYYTDQQRYVYHVDVWRAFPALAGMAKPLWPDRADTADGELVLIDPPLPAGAETWEGVRWDPAAGALVADARPEVGG